MGQGLGPASRLGLKCKDVPLAMWGGAPDGETPKEQPTLRSRSPPCPRRASYAAIPPPLCKTRPFRASGEGSLAAITSARSQGRRGAPPPSWAPFWVPREPWTPRGIPLYPPAPQPQRPPGELAGRELTSPDGIRSLATAAKPSSDWLRNEREPPNDWLRAWGGGGGPGLRDGRSPCPPPLPAALPYRPALPGQARAPVKVRYSASRLKKEKKMEEMSKKEEVAPQQLPRASGTQYGEARARSYHLPEEEEALSIPGSAEEDEETEAIQAMALGLELQCRLQRHLDQLQAKAKAKAQIKAQVPNLRAQPLPHRGCQGEPQIKDQDWGTSLGQVSEEEFQPREKGSFKSFGELLWDAKWGSDEKGEITTAEAPNLYLRNRQVPKGATTLGLTPYTPSLRATSSQKFGETLIPVAEQQESSRTFGRKMVAFQERNSTGN
ncbi:uncharacterized protein LOC141501029 [Macrotis lagotis]|uniref:uncharacterized protein LOC141501029 n=1 Tax=Macrotis lagotis TaxID=92651 RepID=UPI003D68E6CA